ncbi:MAG: flagellar FlbD family protein [Anaeromicrobium sp.]|jgi:flagellar protein FlbD|uniref:flagellar FlbD family protein n=1 Tax=Anaeromicrobium sp. TaxID=1929132 RepID=UPI0025EF3AF7|nr:flagellar FlbD family protein [Anaeromicrobium sp.]MCT4595586.1 flagellar FlbD family protein [Anaeromicrobium sp.]
MIRLRKLNGKEFILNCELIESVENNPDTTITLTSGKKIVVLEGDSEVIEKIIEYKRNIYNRFTVKQ